MKSAAEPEYTILIPSIRYQPPEANRVFIRNWSASTPRERFRALASIAGKDSILLQLLTSFATDSAIESALGDFISLSLELASQPGLGVLLRANVYLDPISETERILGAPLSTLGEGTDPVDAYARMRLEPQWEQGNHGGVMKPAFRYYWCARRSEGVTLQCLEVVPGRKLETDGELEASRIRAQRIADDSLVLASAVEAAQRWRDTLNVVRREMLRDRDLESIQASLLAIRASEERFQGLRRDYARTLRAYRDASRQAARLGRMAAALNVMAQASSVFSGESAQARRNSDSARTQSDLHRDALGGMIRMMQSARSDILMHDGSIRSLLIERSIQFDLAIPVVDVPELP